VNKTSELLVEVSILAVLFCRYFARYYIAKSEFLSTWVGLLSNGVGLLLRERERVLENTPTPLFARECTLEVSSFNELENLHTTQKTQY